MDAEADSLMVERLDLFQSTKESKMLINKQGLGPSPKPQRLYVGQGKVEETGAVYPWYVYDIDTDVSTPVFEPSLTGELVGLKVVKTVYKKEEIMKLDISIKSGKVLWIVRSGVDTVFSRGVLLTLKDMQAEDLLTPLLLYAEPASEGSVFGSLYDPDTLKHYPKQWDADAKLFPIITALQETLGYPVQTVDGIRQEYADRQARQSGS